MIYGSTATRALSKRIWRRRVDYRLAFHRMKSAGPNDIDGQAGGRASGEQASQTPYKITAILRSARRSRPRLSATDRLIPRRRGRFQMRNQVAPGLPDNYLFP